MNERAQEQVDAFLHILRSRYGLSDDDIGEFVDDMLRIRRGVRFARRMGEWSAKVVVTILVTAFFSGLGTGFYHIFTMIVHKR